MALVCVTVESAESVRKTSAVASECMMHLGASHTTC